jgi:hypothetical protein
VQLAKEAAGLVRVLFGDESGFTENPLLTQAWTPKGEPHAHEMKTGTRARLNGIGCCDFNLRSVTLFLDWQAKGLHIHFLSPYSPELNRIEILWRKMKRLRPFRLLEIKEL